MLRAAAIAVGCVCVAAAGSALGMRVAGASVHDTALGQVSLTVEPSLPGRVDVFIPLADWGIRSNALDAPLVLKAEARSVERQALLRAAGGDRTVLQRARADTREAVGDALVRAVIWSTLATLLLALALALAAGARLGSLGRRGLIVAGCTVAAALLSAGSALAASWTFDASAFDQPEFYARGAELNQLLDVASKSQHATEAYESSVDRTLSGYAKVLAGAARLVELEQPDSFGLVSDVHGNRPALRALAPAFSGQPVLFAGDLGHEGNDAEAELFTPAVSKLGDPVVAVSGNHDSRTLMDELERAGVIVLNGGDAMIAGGRRVAGWPDPLEWQGERPDDPDRIFSFGQLPDGDAAFDGAAADLIAWFDGLERRPDIVMVHQNGLAQELARQVAGQPDAAPLTVLTGHDHAQHIDRYGEVVVVDAGSAGAGGVFGVGTQALGIASLEFGSTGLRAVDMIQIEPLSGAAQAERIVLDAEDACDKDLLVCRDKGED